MKEKGKEKTVNRREFIRKASLITLGAYALTSPVISGCRKLTDQYAKLKISEKKCTGCGECLEACYYGAILLPQRSIYDIIPGLCVECRECLPTCDFDAIEIFEVGYHIRKDICRSCGQCVSVCTYEAIDISVLTYSINQATCIECGQCMPSCSKNALEIYPSTFSVNSGCVGCGDCLTACLSQGNCISYVNGIDYYIVKPTCGCGPDFCKNACPEGAITIVGNKAVINHTICIRCGICADACPFNEIIPCKVQIDQAGCNHCGSCFTACTYNGITKTVPPNHQAPVINTALCTSCGDCFNTNACSYGAIEKDIPADYHDPFIDNSKCELCGDCIDQVACEYGAIYKQTDIDYLPPGINHDKCTACGACLDENACPDYNAIIRDLKTAKIDTKACTKCMKCEYVCRYDAIKTY